MSTVCIVPVRDRPELTQRFLECMQEQALDAILVLDNGSGAPTVRMLEDAQRRDERITRLPLPRLGIYELWNAGLEHAENQTRNNPTPEILNLLVCNNDIELHPGSVEILASKLRSRRDLWAVYPDDRWPYELGVHASRIRAGRGVARDGGLYGPCFMVAVDRLPWRPLVSEPGYEWWFGDDHLARQIQEEGGVHARVVGVPVLHANEGTARHHPETQQMRMRDRRRWIDSQRKRKPGARGRRMPPGTKVWAPGGKRIDQG